THTYSGMEDSPAPFASSSTNNTTSNNSTGSYTVQSVDTLASIANSQGVSLDALLNANGLNTSSTIYPGDVLQLSGDAASGESSAASEDASVGPNSGESSAADTDSDVSTVSTASTGSGATGTTA